MNLSAQQQEEKAQLFSRIQQALSLCDKNNLPAALEIYDSLPKKIPDDIQLLEAMGVLSHYLKQHAAAIEYLSKVVVMAPDNIQHLGHLAIACIEAGRLAEAKHLLDRILAINPDSADALISLGKIYLDQQNYRAAKQVMEKALALSPNDSSLLCNLAIAYDLLGQPQQALDAATRARRINPKGSIANRVLAKLYLQLGKIEEAIKFYKKQLELDRYSGICYWGIASAHKTTEADRGFLNDIETLLLESMPPVERGFIHFAAGKMYDDLGEWDKAFDHYKKGNTLRKPSTAPQSTHKFTQKIRRTCRPKLEKLSVSSSTNTESPIFILGMPRTGSTLVEQIIATQPEVASAGELHFMNRLAEQIFLPLNKPAAEIEKQLTPAALTQHAADYLQILRSNGREQAKHLIDKTPGNSNYIGLLLLMFPNARFIHTIRHPLDTLLSCYFQPFNEVHWARDFQWMSKAYMFYRQNLGYWQHLLPADRILDVHYENLIAHPEEESRRIMAYCGLPWNDSCLTLFTRGDNIRTASAWQVRQPIYQTSKMRWVHYAPYLQELASGLRPYLSENDCSILREHGLMIKSPGALERWWLNLRRYG